MNERSGPCCGLAVHVFKDIDCLKEEFVQVIFLSLNKFDFIFKMSTEIYLFEGEFRMWRGEYFYFASRKARCKLILDLFPSLQKAPRNVLQINIIFLPSFSS